MRFLIFELGNFTSVCILWLFLTQKGILKKKWFQFNHEVKIERPKLQCEKARSERYLRQKPISWTTVNCGVKTYASCLVQTLGPCNLGPKSSMGSSSSNPTLFRFTLRLLNTIGPAVVSILCSAFLSSCAETQLSKLSIKSLFMMLRSFHLK